MLLRLLISFLVASLLPGCLQTDPRQSKDPSLAPTIGEKLPRVPCDARLYMVGSAQLAKSCSTVVGGIPYLIGTVDDSTVCWVSTQDSGFVTPEGVRIGDNFQTVRSKQVTEIMAEPGWAYISRLPSKWYAMYGGIPGVADSTIVSSWRRDSTVHVLFRWYR
jgi:hypothetical protein